ncbi:major facilitator superfamily domain-containing protein [Polychytrium aggregatum]|uniref:major facilitator superfamily domain-containing protein n=1 Tax=Polychytrium aggregatum TaxID=110093 RepID=UPI0022FDE40B|nr:major facilitator superfamily domain-containing protein [Polychytrium aggregatum]XP_052970472.1 major facilitator superfamily domain-containing protein [Polychytrium aggregatum]KAI9199775.1 major facilitator superfamily domain-containing protein [Polychytrium aggregatum]KAI9208392.1 major facilitator superfamily domain-containing protein [Polychytrium aggregatum]
MSSSEAPPPPPSNPLIRWSQVFLLFVLNISCSLIWLIYTPVADASTSYFSTSLTTINWINNVYILSFLPGSICSAILLDSYGIRKTVLFGSFFQFVGAGLCYGGSFISNPTGKIVLAFIGEAFAGFSQPSFLDACPKLSTIWFAPEERAIPTACSTIGNPIGGAVAFLLVPAILLGYTCGTFALFAISAVACIEPKQLASVQAKDAEVSFKTAFMKCVKLRLFWQLAATMAIGTAVFSNITSYLNQIMSPYGYSADDTGTMGAVLVFSGVIATFMFGYLADRSRRHALILKLNSSFMVVSYLFFALIFNRPNILPVLVVSCFFIGVFTVGSLPVFLDMIVAVTRKDGVGEGVSMALLWGTAQLLVVIFSVIWDRTRTVDQEYPAVPWIVFGSCLVGAIPTLLYPLRSDMRELEVLEKLAQQDVKRPEGL